MHVRMISLGNLKPQYIRHSFTMSVLDVEEISLENASRQNLGYDSQFLPARRYASAGLCDSDVSVCLSVRLSVCHTPVLCVAERKQGREMYTF